MKRLIAMLGCAVLLAAVIPNPRRMNPSRPSRRVEYRFDLILSRMHQYRQISDQEFESARKESGDRGATRHNERVAESEACNVRRVNERRGLPCHQDS